MKSNSSLSLLTHLLKLQFRAILSRYWQLMHNKLLIISLLALIFTPPSALSAFYQLWTELVLFKAGGSAHLSAFLVVEFISFLFLIVHAQDVRLSSIRLFELTLPIPFRIRLFTKTVEGVFSQIPSLFLLIIAFMSHLNRQISLRDSSNVAQS
jgi:hypothetical protein